MRSQESGRKEKKPAFRRQRKPPAPTGIGVMRRPPREYDPNAVRRVEPPPRPRPPEDEDDVFDLPAPELAPAPESREKRFVRLTITKNREHAPRLERWREEYRRDHPVFSRWHSSGLEQAEIEHAGERLRAILFTLLEDCPGWSERIADAKHVASWVWSGHPFSKTFTLAGTGTRVRRETRKRCLRELAEEGWNVRYEQVASEAPPEKKERRLAEPPRFRLTLRLDPGVVAARRKELEESHGSLEPFQIERMLQEDFVRRLHVKLSHLLFDSPVRSSDGDPLAVDLVLRAWDRKPGEPAPHVDLPREKSRRGRNKDSGWEQERRAKILLDLAKDGLLVDFEQAGGKKAPPSVREPLGYEEELFDAGAPERGKPKPSVFEAPTSQSMRREVLEKGWNQIDHARRGTNAKPPRKQYRRGDSGGRSAEM